MKPLEIPFFRIFLPQSCPPWSQGQFRPASWAPARVCGCLWAGQVCLSSILGAFTTPVFGWLPCAPCARGLERAQTLCRFIHPAGSPLPVSPPRPLPRHCSQGPFVPSLRLESPRKSVFLSTPFSLTACPATCPRGKQERKEKRQGNSPTLPVTGPFPPLLWPERGFLLHFRVPGPATIAATEAQPSV